MSKVRKIIKVLAKKASGLDRKAKLAEMKKGLMALDLVRMQDCLAGTFPRISRDNIDAVGVLLDRASVRR
jgi:hypothetical protein